MISTAELVPDRPHEHRILLVDVSWQAYEELRAVPQTRRLRMTYDRGELELMSPSKRHERLGYVLGRFIDVLTEELNVPMQGCRSTTFKRSDLSRGLEADNCYYIANEALVREREEIDLSVDPPPDLSVEIDISSSSIDRMSIYAALRVPEVWRHDSESLKFFSLNEGGQYLEIERSIAFPQITPDMLLEFLDHLYLMDETSLIREFRQWVRTELLSGPDAPQP
ncbi:MAG TPA: Uma2 family endonuclease [Planctomycetaceae bacterium]|nr:Uma2 family endonuclease [Planctomycetaceae bacterium]